MPSYRCWHVRLSSAYAATAANGDFMARACSPSVAGCLTRQDVSRKNNGNDERLSDRVALGRRYPARGRPWLI
jgi:hypothetical protein